MSTMQPGGAPSVTLNEVVQFALPSGSLVATGADCLDRRVYWARLLRARPAGLGSVEPGELLLVPDALFAASTDARVLARLVGELVDAGAVAFLVAGQAPEALRSECQSAGVPLLQVPDGTSLGEVERAIVGLILDRDAQLRRRAEEVYGRLLSTMLADAGFGALLGTLGEATGLRAAVFDDAFAQQAAWPDEDEFRRAVSAAAMPIFARESSAVLARAGRPQAVAVELQGGGWSGHLYPLRIGSAWAGYLALLGRTGQNVELDRLLAERASTLVALELAKQRTVAEAVQRGRGEFLDDLLEGSYPSAEVVLARGHQLGYDLLRPHLLFVLAPDPSGSDGAEIDGSLPAARRRRRFAEVARAVVLQREERSLVVERDGGLVVLLPGLPADEAGATSEVVEQARAAIGAALPGLGVSAGVGRLARQPSEFAMAHGEARQALRVAQRLLGGGRTVHFGRVGVERLLVHLLDAPELERFALDYLGSLIGYDQKHRGDLVHTLDVFLRCNGNHVRAAQELHLHRNTLLYRLERTREILGRDLEDADTRLALQVALRIRRALPARAALSGEPEARVAARKQRAG